ncbi:hypothetical protein GF420_06410 [candidate division GN15 bacterium]|nr:hypothetical protein [candidate division GN15 bacterium]
MIARLLTLLAVVVCLSIPLGVQAQEDIPADTVSSLPGVEVETSVSQAEMFVGDRVTYTVAITYDSTIELVPPPLGANLGAFDVKDYEPDQETVLEDGRIRSETVFTLSTFTTGEYVIPPLPVVFKMPDGTARLIMAEGLPITVKSLLGEAGEGADTLDIKPLKAQYEFEPEIPAYYYWGGGMLLVSIIALVLWFIFRKRKGDEAPVDTRTAWEIAFEDLARLQERRLPAEERFKEYYIELTEIARAYLGRMYKVDVLEMTTTEFHEAFRDIRLPGELYQRITDFLKHADLVKFARYTPDSARTEEDLNLVHAMISEIRDEHLRRLEAEVRAAKNGAARSTEERAA